MAASEGKIIETIDVAYFVRGYTSDIAPNDTHRFGIGHDSVFVFTTNGASTNQFGVFYVNNGGDNRFVQKILGEYAIEVYLDAFSSELVIHNTLSWNVVYSILGYVTRTL